MAKLRKGRRPRLRAMRWRPPYTPQKSRAARRRQPVQNSHRRKAMKKNAKSGEQKKMKGKKYLKELRKLQGELCKLQEWVKHKGLRVIILFEGRDAAGKGGTIKAITERVSPRVFRLVALPATPRRANPHISIP